MDKKRTLLEITSARKLLNIIPTEADWKRYDVVLCNCLSIFDPKKDIEEEMAKVCYLAKKKVILNLLVEDSKKDEHSWGKKGSKVRKGTENERTLMTSLRIRRRLNDFAFVVTGEVKYKGQERVITAERMPETKWDGKTPLWEYPEHTVVEVPLTFHDWQGFYKRIDREKEDWIKHERVEKLIAEFKPWLFVPIYFCKDSQHVRQGAHRMEVARRMGGASIKVRIMRVWWKKFESGKWIDSTPESLPFLEDIEPNSGFLKGEGT